MTSLETARLLAENSLLRLLASLPDDYPPFQIETAIGTRVAVLRIGTPTDLPTPKPVGALSPREQEILDAVGVEVARLGRRVKGAEVRAALTAAGNRWGLSTINQTLADLVALGHLSNDNDKRGYGVPG